MVCDNMAISHRAVIRYLGLKGLTPKGGTEKMAPEKMAPEKMAPEKMAPGKHGTRKKWHYVNLEKMAPYLFYGLLQSMGKLIATCHKTSHESMFEFLLIAIYFKHTQL